MKESQIMVLDENEKKFVKLLVDLGMDKNVAKTFTSLANGDELRSKQIQRTTGLSQPEVSMAINSLKEDDFIQERMIEREKRGRPMMAYSLAKPLSKVMKEIENRWRMEKQKEKRKIEKAKELIKEF
ncbi:ArsR family transcriptional regulator [archaeon SCG-AAA382B04]|nr:ArsR family transcriptional regulator [archaeon SCG-AAA382B04]